MNFLNIWICSDKSLFPIADYQGSSEMTKFLRNSSILVGTMTKPNHPINLIGVDFFMPWLRSIYMNKNMNKSCPKLELFMIDWSDFFLRQYQEHKNICFYTMNKCRNIMSPVEFNSILMAQAGRESSLLGLFCARFSFHHPTKDSSSHFPIPNARPRLLQKVHVALQSYTIITM